MIPKVIHYCWLSDDPLPDKLQYCINSWHKYLPDYKVIRWDLKRFPLDKSLWVKQAFERKRYAFAADYIRLYALATEGGIYLDSDVEVLKPFDDLLHLPYFVCKENSPQGIEAAIIGAESNTPWVLRCLEYYNDKSFLSIDGKEQTQVLPAILKSCIERHFRIRYIDAPSEFAASTDEVCILPMDYFSPKNYVTKKIQITNRTYAIHHFAGSWQPLWKKILLRIWVPFSVRFPAVACRLKRLLR